MALYVHSSGLWRPVVAIYRHNGSMWRNQFNVWRHNGTAWENIYYVAPGSPTDWEQGHDELDWVYGQENQFAPWVTFSYPYNNGGMTLSYEWEISTPGSPGTWTTYFSGSFELNHGLNREGVGSNYVLIPWMQQRYFRALIKISNGSTESSVYSPVYAITRQMQINP